VKIPLIGLVNSGEWRCRDRDYANSVSGIAWALSSDGLATIASKLGVFAAEIWTVLSVEASGCGYLPDGRPRILYERHIFHRLTRGMVAAMSQSEGGQLAAMGNFLVSQKIHTALRAHDWTTFARV